VGSDHGLDRVFSALRRAVASTDPLQDRVAEVVHGICDLNRESFPDHETWDLFQALLAKSASCAARGDEKAVAAAPDGQSSKMAPETGWLACSSEHTHHKGNGHERVGKQP
jgi:hypothetical protein